MRWKRDASPALLLALGPGRWRIGSTLVGGVTSSAASLASYLLGIGANSTTGVVSSVLDYLSSGANYVRYVSGEQTTYKTA